MRYEFILRKETCFFYWVQASCGWKKYDPEVTSYRYFKEKASPFSRDEYVAFNKIADILSSSNQPRSILAELYEGMAMNAEAKCILEFSEKLQSKFEDIWPDIEVTLLQSKKQLEKIDFSQFNVHMRDIATFLDSSLDDEPIKVYLLQNSSDAPPVGHQIENTAFILLHPGMQKSAIKNNTTIGTLLHETIHILEFRSKLTRRLTYAAYNDSIKQESKNASAGMTWKMVYAEVIVYCFINNITGGYLRPEVFGMLRPKVDDMREGFNRLRSKKRQSTQDVLAWIALNIQDDVERYLEDGRRFDDHIAHNISTLLLEYI